jgi:hypothetical protein
MEAYKTETPVDRHSAQKQDARWAVVYWLALKPTAKTSRPLLGVASAAYEMKKVLELNQGAASA